MQISATDSTTRFPVAGDTLSKELDGKAFLQLVAAQLQHQDPLEPMDPNTFVMQLIQLTTLEQSQSMADSINSMSLATQLGSAASLIGREVQYYLPGNMETEHGVVKEVTAEKGIVSVMINDMQVPLNKLVVVGDLTLNADSEQVD